MLQRDYFIRLIEEFQVALRKVLEKDEGDRDDAAIKDLYRQYVGPYDEVRNLSVDELLTYSHDRWLPEQRMDRLHFAAELLYAEATFKANPLRAMLLDKALKLYAYVDANSGVMSMARLQKLQWIRQALGPEAQA
jgi:hypothetical protein